MKIFNWFQRKINGKQGTNKQNSVTVSNHMLHQPCKEEFSNWPIELLAIGTFGNNSLKYSVNLNHQPSCPDHPEELTPEEFGQLHKELQILLCEQSPPSSDSAKDSTKDLEKFYECLQNLEDDRSTSEQVSGCSRYKESHLKQSSSVVCGKKLEKSSSGIGKKSLSYLLKKAFLRRSGFTSPPPPPLLRDPILQSKFEKLSLEKIQKTILHKKVFPQASSPRSNMKKKYLDNGNVLESDSEDEAFESMKGANKWDNSDSDFIVLEI